MQVQIAQSAKDDLRGASRHYDDQEIGQGKRFSACFRETAGKLRFSGGMHEKVEGLHRCLMRPYPFAIFYAKRDQLVVVLAIVDCRRDPKAIERHLNRVKNSTESESA